MMTCEVIGCSANDQVTSGTGATPGSKTLPASSQASSLACSNIIATSSSTEYAVSSLRRKTTVPREGSASILCSGKLAWYLDTTALSIYSSTVKDSSKAEKWWVITFWPSSSTKYLNPSLGYFTAVLRASAPKVRSPFLSATTFAVFRLLSLMSDNGNQL